MNIGIMKVAVFRDVIPFNLAGVYQNVRRRKGRRISLLTHLP
jgi:hypothetical protein